MARTWRHCWTQRCLVLLISFQLLATLPLSYRDYSNNSPNSYANGAPATTTQQHNTNFNDRHNLHQRYLHTSNNINKNVKDVVGKGTTPYRRREIVQDVMDDDDEGDSNDNDDNSIDSFSDDAGTNSNSNSPQTNSRAAATAATVRQLKIASILCNSDVPQLLGPDWNGTFSTNSGDGAYPSLNRACTFTMQAMPSSSGSSSDSGGNGRPIPYVVALTFSTPIQLVCGTDYLTLYDGPDVSAPILAKICGNIWSDKIPTFYSTGSVLTAVFSSQESSPGSFGFSAVWYSIETAGFKDFTPRSQHAMAYDPKKDMVYIMGGTSLRNPFMDDLLTYTFASNRWNKLTAARSPDPRYGHFAFMHNDDLYIYGGHSIIGALADIWKFDGKTWLYVFGGLTSSGTTSRELNIYDLATNRWTKMDHQNSVGLSGATAVYHQATDSIYYFGGMVNQTSRNVITYQYRIYQELWYALAPRIDPLTGTPVSYWNVTDAPALNTTAHDDDGDSNSGQNSTVQILSPVMYDPLTTIWTPAGVIGEDTVVMYGGMRPYGPGVNEREQSCFASSFAIYDLSCQNWTSYDVSDLDGVLKGRVNHTMVIRPPGAPGGSRTAYTAYIFGGFDGTDRADMLNATMTIPATTPGAINNCRALRWCNLYDDCQYCPTNYCSYINGLCLFDTDKAKNAQILAGNSNDIPRSGTIQDLLRQRPQLRGQVQNLDICPSRTALELTNPYSGTIQSGQEISFRIYIDTADLNIQYEIRTLPTSALEFRSLNVWEGFMNMYWRADHGLTDDSWIAAVSDPSTLDLPTMSSNSSDNPVISPGGLLNTSELMNRWTKYSGLDADPSVSAIRDDTSYIYFLASDPRRFAGYYVFSLTNHNPTALSYSVTVTLLNHPTSVDKPPGARFNMATLGFFMLGFILAVVLLVITARKIRQLIEDRDASQRTAEMQLLVDEDDDRRRNNRGGLNGGMTLIQMDGSMLLKKPLYRIVVGVQDMSKEVFGLSGSNLRYRHVRGHGPHRGLKDQGRLDSKSKGASTAASVLPQSLSHPMVVQSVVEVHDPTSPRRERRSRVRSDFIRDIGSAPLPLTAAEESMIEKEASALARSLSFVECRKLSISTPNLANTTETNSKEKDQSKIGTAQSSLWDKSTPSLIRQASSRNEHHHKDPSNQDTTPQRPSNNFDETGLQRGWSLRSLKRNSSLSRSFSHRSKTTAEEREGLTNQQTCIEEEDPAGAGDGVSGRGSFDSEQEIVDLGGLLSPTDLLQQRQEQIEKHSQEEEEAAWRRRRRRNPIKVQPISIEPLPFHSGLVPRTMAHLKKYRRNLARQQKRQQQQLQRHHPQHQGQGQGQRQYQPPMSRQLSNESFRSRRRSPVSPTFGPTQLEPQGRHQVRATKSQGSLREVCRAASRMASRSNGNIFPRNADVEADEVVPEPKSLVEKKSSPQLGWSRNDSREDSEAAIEMRQLTVSSRSGGGSNGRGVGIGVGVGVGIGGQGHDKAESMMDDNCRHEDLDGSGPLRSPFSSPVQERANQLQVQQSDQPPQRQQDARDGGGAQKQKRPIKMRGRQEYEPGPLLAMNILIVFPGDSGSRKVSQQGGGSSTSNGAKEVVEQERELGEMEEKDDNRDTLYNSEKRLPPMAIGTVFVPDPVRWWAYKAKQQLDRQKLERQLRRMHNKQSRNKDKLHVYQQQEFKPSSLSKGRRES
ncbi:Multiple epidermal growth factor-like domains protein 8 [Linnemannia schmuckeri]|uniref:Multiple epidermal growth factor-like domains protein 8 n=1 Tax=Linnemannia schmuckeri TaxID=64567 RepID=A0A9P5V9P2_9FUNG|nr:Multiple epidermal growth factor-like domains protein 8 [Linnemannia schmuckeri]